MPARPASKLAFAASKASFVFVSENPGATTLPNAATCALYGFYLKHLIPFWGGLITGDREGFVYLARSIKAFPDQQGLAAMMEKAGFEDVIWKNYTGGIAAVHVARKPAR